MAERYTIVGRTSSHFTRAARIFAFEHGVAHDFELVVDLTSLSTSDYGENPALRLPVLKESERAWFGALNVCRALSRASSERLRIVWPEQLSTPLLSNAQELTLQAMASEVELIMSGNAAASSTPFSNKRRVSLENSVRWLEQHVDAVLTALPAERDLSYLETTLFCLIEHLDFRQVLSTQPFERLSAFRASFAERASARSTPFMFDASRPAS